MKSIIPEDLIYRFCSKLDFGDFTNKVAADATRLCQRMGRDWMVMGRRPSGICGACILMAARMWNFRRTVAEVVYIVKVTTHTIEQRLDEFTVTESSELSIEDFLNKEFLESRHDPPAFYKGTTNWQEKLEKDGKVRKRKRVITDIDGDEHELRSESGTPAPDGSATPRASPGTTNMPPPPIPRPPPDTSHMRQVAEFLPRALDRDEGRELVVPFDPNAIPKRPPRKNAIGDRNVTDGKNSEDPLADEAVDELAAAYGTPEEDLDNEQDQEEVPVEPEPQRRSRKKGSAEPVLTFNDEWERDEAELEQQITEVINDPHSDIHSKALATAAHVAHIKGEWARSLLPQRELKMDEIIGEDEFADDPEVQFCLLAPHEVKLKESIWINANKDWLRKRQEKIYRKQMEELGPPKRKRSRMKKPRIGEGQLTPASSASEAAIEALKKRSTYSKRINYDAIESLFTTKKDRGPGSVVSRNDNDSETASVTDGGTPAPARLQLVPVKPSLVATDNGEGGDEEEGPPEEVYDDYYSEDPPNYDEQPGYDEDGYGGDGYEEEEFY